MKETRISRWKKYRQDILDNKNLDESIINSDPNLKKILNKIQIDLENIDSDVNKTKKNNIRSYAQELEEKQINELIEHISKNENMKSKYQLNKDLNSHEFDKYIEELFSEFIISNVEETTELQIRKIKFDKIEQNKYNKKDPNMNDKNRQKINIAIDGPSGVGKSTIAKKISHLLNLTFINTGLMYRAIAFYCLKNNIDIHNEKEIKNILDQIKLNISVNDTVQINNIIVEENLHTDQISSLASIIARYESVRKYCVKSQQKMSIENPGVVMEGRDIGTIVLPKADLKIFLTASPEVRAQRRINQLKEKGEKVDEQSIYLNVLERDKRDRERTIAPLIPAEDAIIIDTSLISIDEVIDKIILLAKNKN